jgi:hypothetical protein
MKTTKNIIKWLKMKKEQNKFFGYYVDDEVFIIRFPSQYEDKIIGILSNSLKEIPYMMSYGYWYHYNIDDVKIYIHLNHPKLNEENLYSLLSALKSAEEELKI